MKLPTYFTDFLKEIRLTDSQVKDCVTGHTTLRNRLLADEDLAEIIVTTFLQGSYRRSTATRPHEGQRSDVDVVVVTRLDRDKWTPGQAFARFKPFMDKHYKGKYRFNGRSIHISLSYVDLDLVITSAPSEVQEAILLSDSVSGNDFLAEAPDWMLRKSWPSLEKRTRPGAMASLRAAQEEPEWKLAPLWIPDRDAREWEETHPLAQIDWTADKNRATNGNYVNVVKVIKWLRRINPGKFEHPKGYPVEHIVGTCCPDGITAVDEGVVQTLEKLRDYYRSDALAEQTPWLPDHGVPSHNVFHRVSGEEFSEFHVQITGAASVAREAYDEEDLHTSACLWKSLLGDRFPDPPPGSGPGDGGGGGNSPQPGGYSPRTGVTTIGGSRFA